MKDNWEFLQLVTKMDIVDPKMIAEHSPHSDCIAASAIQMLFGYHIASGGRDVFSIPIQPDCVMKVAQTDHAIAANRKEFQFSNAVFHLPEARWIAPCHYISECGRYLVMSRASALTIDLLPEIEIPRIFMDAHTRNFGLIHSRTVAIDYEHVAAMPGDSEWLRYTRETYRPFSEINRKAKLANNHGCPA